MIQIWAGRPPLSADAIASALQEVGSDHSNAWLQLLGSQDAIYDEVLELLANE